MAASYFPPGICRAYSSKMEPYDGYEVNQLAKQENGGTACLGPRLAAVI